jgi:probable HAF family extracellular repeat protein
VYPHINEVQITGRRSLLVGASDQESLLYGSGASGYDFFPAVRVAWSSSDTTVAKVSATGMVQARKAGVATIYATTAARADSTRVRVLAAAYHLTLLGTLGGTFSEALDVNDAGVVVGNAQRAAGDTVAFRWQGGAMTALARPRFPANSGSALIDAQGRVVGTAEIAGPAGGVVTAVSDAGTLAGYWPSNSPSNLATDSAFTVAAGSVRTLPGLDCTPFVDPRPYAVNDAGAAVGVAYTGPTSCTFGTVRAVYWPVTGPVATYYLGYFMAPSAATAINNKGQYAYWTICRFCPLYSSAHGHLVSGAADDGLGSLIPAGEEYPLDLNEKAEVVGRAMVGTDGGGTRRYHGFISQGGVMTDVNDLVMDGTWEIVAVTGINESGAMVGTARNRTTGQMMAVLVTPP